MSNSTITTVLLPGPFNSTFHFPDCLDIDILASNTTNSTSCLDLGLDLGGSYDDDASSTSTAILAHLTDSSDPSSSSPVCEGLQRYSLLGTVLLAFVIGLVALATIAGNALVIASFATDRKLRSFGNYFILNLAISDLIVGLLIAVYTPYIIRGCWELTRVGCLIFTFLDYVVPLASAWNMALISLDRYWSVARAIEYRVLVNPRRAVALMTIPWLAGTMWYGPTVLFWSLITERQVVPEHKCYVEFYDRVAYLIASSVVEFVLPFLTVATINILIYVNIRGRSRGLVRTSTAEPDSQTTLKAKSLLARDKKSARSLAILIIVFLVTWAPFEVCAFVNPVCNFCIPESASDVVFWLLWMNSTINPILYPFLQQRFRVAFLRILCRLSKHPKIHVHSYMERRTLARSIADT